MCICARTYWSAWGSCQLFQCLSLFKQGSLYSRFTVEWKVLATHRYIRFNSKSDKYLLSFLPVAFRRQHFDKIDLRNIFAYIHLLVCWYKILRWDIAMVTWIHDLTEKLYKICSLCYLSELQEFRQSHFCNTFLLRETLNSGGRGDFCLYSVHFFSSVNEGQLLLMFVCNFCFVITIIIFYSYIYFRINFNFTHNLCKRTNVHELTART